MIIILIILVIIIFYKSKFIKNGINEEYVSIETTRKINGIFIIFVFLSHSIQYITYSNSLVDLSGIFIIQQLNQLMVTTFLFFSGFGVYESIKKKSVDYVDTMPKKRILNLLIKFDIAVIIFYIVSNFLSIGYDVKTLLLSFIGWANVGNSNWYIFAILFLYLITYCVFKYIKVKDYFCIGIVTLLTICYCFIISNFKPDFWYNTVLCYPLGMWFSLYRSKIELKFKENMKFYYIVLLVSILVLVLTFLYKQNMYIHSTIYVFAFIACVILFSMKVKINSDYLKFMGTNLFFIYIYQRLPMMILKNYDIFTDNGYLFLSTSFIIIIGLTLVIVEIMERKKYKIIKRG